MFLLVLVSSFHCCDSQIIKEHFNRKWVYNEGQDEIKFNTNNFSLVVNLGEMMLAKTAEFHYIKGEQNFRVSGYLYDDQYFTYKGHTTYSVPKNWKKFKKIENEFFTFQEFKNLTKYISEENGTVISVFTMNLNDRIDYSKAVNFLTTKYGYNTPYLEKGEIPVYADFTFPNGEILVLNVLQSIENIDEDFYYDQQDLDRSLNQEVSIKNPSKVEPKYCGSFQEGVELPKVESLVSDFRVTLCSYYDHWGYRNNQELQNYYGKELERMAQLIKERELLSDVELKRFRQVVEADKIDNLEKNFIGKKNLSLD